MKNIIIIVFLMLSYYLVFSTIIEVDINGSTLFEEIQTAIEVSVNGDTILVHPGIYVENVDFTEKSITLASFEMLTGDSTYIDSTIIDGNQTGSCVLISYVEAGHLQGFSLRNGSGSTYLSSTPVGGGVLIRNSIVTISSCNIYNNTASAGGGIYVNEAELFLSNTSIYNNHAFHSAGGIFIVNNTNIVFNSEYLNNIYLNTSFRGNDFWIIEDEVDIILNQFTVLEPDNFFIGSYESSYTFSCLSAVIEPVAADLYVSSTGDDNNSGLSEFEPLQTMALALIMIDADSLNPKTIHVADGVYSPLTTYEKFPLNLRSYVGIVGESEENTIIEGENQQSSIMGGWNSEQGVVIKNFTVQNVKIGFGDWSPFPFFFTSPGDEIVGFSVRMENITISNVSQYEADNHCNCITIAQGDEVILKNITLTDSECHRALFISGDNVYGENIKISNIQGVNEECVGGAMVITNYIQTEGEINRFINLDISSNEDIMYEWNTSSAILICNSNNAIISNATIVDNTCHPNHGGAITVEGASLTLINSIVHNNSPYPVQLREDLTYGSAFFTVENCLFTEGDENIMTSGDCVINWLDGNICGDPLFTYSQFNPYFLLADSPCIDAGTTSLQQYFGDSYEIPQYDLAGNPRIFGDTVDMGCYEWQGVSAESDLISENKSSIWNYPNPFNPDTIINFNIHTSSHIELNIFNLKGQLVKHLVNDFFESGSYSAKWNSTDDLGNSVSSGIFFYQLKQKDFILTGKCILLK